MTIYPVIDIPLIKKPNRWYAIPVFGGLVKIIMLIPVFIWLGLVGFASLVFIVINSFVVLFTGKYWKNAYDINVLLIRLLLKTQYFFWGLINAYPGFDGKTKDFTVEIPYPKKPNRWYAVPLFGGLARFLLLIPYLIFTSIMQNAANVAGSIASFPVLFMGKYPESLYELVRDNIRLNTSDMMYFAGLSDTYPSFWISMKNKGIKILFIILGTLIFLSNTVGKFQNQSHTTPTSSSQFHYSVPTNSTY